LAAQIANRREVKTMAKGRQAVRRLVNGGAAADAPERGSQADEGAGGGGLPENPEARGPEDFGPGGSGGPSARGGRTGSQMRSPGGRTRGGAPSGG
jgi:hypothetical protein